MNVKEAVIITIGDELLIGQTIDTNSAFIAKALNEAGIWVRRRIAIGDVREEILSSLKEAADMSQLVLITGGLGPTADDITKPCLCEYFGCGFKVDEAALANVQSIFQRLNRPFTERNRKQAEVPEACEVLLNTRGTAPGMWFEKNGVIYVSMPGVPHEMKGLMTDLVIPRLRLDDSLPVVQHRTLLTSGIGESFLADHIQAWEEALPSYLKLAYLPATGQVRLRLTGRWPRAEAHEAELDAQFLQLKSLVAPWMVADQDIPLQQSLIQLLTGRGLTMATAESCTGGYIAHLITSISGSSAIFQGGLVTYSNSMKESMLGVSQETLIAHGAVSEATVREMVAGGLKASGADYCLATSGIMGPGGGTEAKPVGTVWVGFGNRERIDTALLNLRYDRTRNIEMAAQMAMTHLFHFIQKS